jgi:hypothetical protein
MDIENAVDEVKLYNTSLSANEITGVIEGV